MVCGEPLQNTQKICRACTTHSPPFTAMRNLANYEGVIRACIHSLKYENNQGLGEFFAGDLAEMVHQEKWKIDLVLPVPLSAQREAERGYNQAACLAKPLAARLGLHYHPLELNALGIRLVKWGYRGKSGAKMWSEPSELFLKLCLGDEF